MRSVVGLGTGAVPVPAGVGIGGEWMLGGTLVAERWPEERRVTKSRGAFLRADRFRGEVPVAYLVAPGVDGDQLGEFCRRNLASFKASRASIFVQVLPRNAMGKLQKHLLTAE